jgi:hypothetical protein
LNKDNDKLKEFCGEYVHSEIEKAAKSDTSSDFNTLLSKVTEEIKANPPCLDGIKR